MIQVHFPLSSDNQNLNHGFLLKTVSSITVSMKEMNGNEIYQDSHRWL